MTIGQDLSVRFSSLEGRWFLHRGYNHQHKGASLIGYVKDMSFIYHKNNIGPKIEPCGTPDRTGLEEEWTLTAISRKVVGKNVHVTTPKGNMGYDQYTVPDDCSCRTYFCCFPLALANTFPWPFVPILSNFFEKKRTQNHPQCLSGLSRALSPTTFLEIAVYGDYLRAIWEKSGDPHKHTTPDTIVMNWV